MHYKRSTFRAEIGRGGSAGTIVTYAVGGKGGKEDGATFRLNFVGGGIKRQKWTPPFILLGGSGGLLLHEVQYDCYHWPQMERFSPFFSLTGVSSKRFSSGVYVRVHLCERVNCGRAKWP